MNIRNLFRRLTVPVVVIACLSQPLGLGAQEKKAETAQKASKAATKGPFVTKVIHVKHADVNRLRILLQDFGQIRSSSELGVLVATGRPEEIASLEEAVRALDVPRQESEASRGNIELTAYFIGAADQELPDAALPPALEEVVTQLRQAFPYRSYHLLDTATLRLRPGWGAKTSGLISDPSFKRRPPQYNFEVNAGAVSRRGALRTIQLDRIRFHLDLSIPSDLTDPKGELIFQDITVESNIDLQEGKTAVVGKAGIYGVYRGLFLALSATVAE